MYLKQKKRKLFNVKLALIDDNDMEYVPKIVNKTRLTLFVGEEIERKDTLMRTTDFLQEIS